MIDSVCLASRYSFKVLVLFEVDYGLDWIIKRKLLI